MLCPFAAAPAHAQGGREAPITKAWLARHGPGPYLLDSAGYTYRLMEDIRTDGTAFIVGAANVTLDLNGHKVIYGDAPPIAVRNGGFEEGSSPTDVPGWDLSGAPGATRTAALAGMWGAWMLHVPSVNVTRRVVSEPVMVPGGNHTYIATIATRGKDILEVRLNVIDARTGKVLGQMTAKSAVWGYGPVTPFSIAAPGSVKLQIEIEPTPGATGTMDLDFAVVAAADECGIIASPAPWGFPPYLKTARITAATPRTKNFTLRNGTLTQGQSRGYAGASVDCKLLDGIKIDKVTAFVNGIDTVNINAGYAANITIDDCTLRADIERITNRQANFAAIILVKNRGNIAVRGNTILDYPQQGITVTENAPGGKIEIVKNIIKQRAIVTNGYGISLTGVHDFVITHNQISPVNGRGIMLDGWGKVPTDNGDIAHNEISVYEKPNLEYGASLAVTALRIRNWKGQSYHRRLHIHDNVFAARTDEKGVQCAIGMRITQQSSAAAGDPHNVIENNRFTALAATLDPKYSAWAVSISGIESGAGFEISRNVMESNDTSLVFGDNDSYEASNEDMLMVQNTMRRSALGTSHAYRAVAVGAWRTTTDKIRLIASKFEGGATDALVFDPLGAGNFGTGWLLDVNVKGVPATARGTVRVEDKTGKEVFRGKLDESGTIIGIPLVTTLYHFDKTGPKSVRSESLAPFRVTVQAGEVMASREVAIAGNTKVDMTLQGSGKGR